VSAFGTVGLTTGITPQTTPIGRLLLVLAMFTGRLGPLTLALVLFTRPRRARYTWPQEPVKLG
jgi:trk system potassium uptake protein TrkH